MPLKFYCTQFVAGPESYLLVCLLFSCHHAFRHKESMKLDERYSSMALKGLTTCTPTDTTDVRPLIQYQILKCFLTVISTPESEYCTTQFVQAILAEKAHNFLRFVCQTLSLTQFVPSNFTHYVATDQVIFHERCLAFQNYQRKFEKAFETNKKWSHLHESCYTQYLFPQDISRRRVYLHQQTHGIESTNTFVLLRATVRDVHKRSENVRGRN